MIYQLIKRDPTWKAVPIVTLVGALVLPILLVNRDPSGTVQGFHFADPLFLLFFFTSSVTWLTQQQIDTRFQSGLPIAVRDIFWARVLSMMLLVCLPAIGAAASLLTIQGMASLTWATALLKLAILYPPIIAFVQFVGLQELRFGGHKILRGTFYGLCTCFPVVASDFPQFPALAVSIVLSIIVLVTVWYALPNTLELAPKNIRPKVVLRDDTSDDGSDTQSTQPYIPWQPVLRSLFPFLSLLWLTTLFYMTLSLASFSAWTFPLVVIWFSARLQRPGIAWLSAFPIRRRVLPAGVVTPILLVITIAFFLGGGNYAGPLPREIWTVRSQSWPPRTQELPCDRLNVVPPLEFWRRAIGAQAELIQSPWGETFEPPVVSVMRVPIYNPYAVGCKNSQRFYDWQFARATEAAYGRSMTASEYQGPGQGVPPPVTPPVRMRFLNMTVFIGLALVVILHAGIDNWYRFHRLSQPIRRILWTTPITLPCAAIALDLLSPRTGALQFLSWTLPDNLAATVLVVALPLILLCWAIDKQLRESEFVGKPIAAAE